MDLNLECQIDFVDCRKHEIQYRMDSLEQWLKNIYEGDPIDYEKDLYFDCPDHFPTYNALMSSKDQAAGDSVLFQSAMQYPWICEIWLSVHRKTNLFRRLLNCFRPSRRRSFSNLAQEFVRLHAGYFSYPVGFKFYLSYAKERWLLVLSDVKFINYPVFPYPQTRIIFIRNGISFIAR
ncbi:unnamed protein product [Adineta ricciae]|uniref:Uncharacterized protein n=1 Tax=Adineta ricciae TaxID=249248 RepID=A0A815ALY2_ADIRI|nr:unnamed protein product [Adineta ricciae]CAF1259243.1 unnamed protein product [Adineta ricciae]